MEYFPYFCKKLSVNRHYISQRMALNNTLNKKT